MRLSQLLNKDLVAIDQGKRIGSMSGMEMYFDPETGEIDSFVISNRGPIPFFQRKKAEEWHIPWKAIKKIGPDMILFEIHTQTKHQADDLETVNRCTSTQVDE
jgi:YlmC/YmxH family sporulation protein